MSSALAFILTLVFAIILRKTLNDISKYKNGDTVTIIDVKDNMVVLSN